MIQDEIKKRILILDGAMGTAIQQYGLTEADFRGSEFISHPVNLKGNNDILNLTCPEVIRQIHRSYIEAGADIIETNTFNSNAISQAEYRGEKLVYRLNYAGAKLAVTEARAASHQVYVAGSMGPTSKTLSLSPDVNRPEFRPVDFDTLVSTYAEQVSGLIDGGVDLLLVETVFDDHFFYTESFFQVFPYFQSDGAGYGTHRADTACLGYPRHLFEYAGSIPACLKGG